MSKLTVQEAIHNLAVRVNTLEKVVNETNTSQEKTQIENNNDTNIEHIQSVTDTHTKELSDLKKQNTNLENELNRMKQFLNMMTTKFNHLMSIDKKVNIQSNSIEELQKKISEDVQINDLTSEINNIVNSKFSELKISVFDLLKQYNIHESEDRNIQLYVEEQPSTHVEEEQPSTHVESNE